MPFQHFYCLSPPVIMSNREWSGSFTLGWDLPHLSPPNKHIFPFSCYATVSLNFGRCPIFELTTHSPRTVNDHNHAHTPNTMRCPRAYEMRRCHFMPYQVTCIMRATCHITKSWIIIFSKYNSHPSCISCQYIK